MNSQDIVTLNADAYIATILEDRGYATTPHNIDMVKKALRVTLFQTVEYLMHGKTFLRDMDLEKK